MKKLSIWHWLVLVLVLVFTTFLVSGFVLAIVRKGAESAEAASWMQAIGSIGAIVVALVVGTSQRRSDRALERERRHHDEVGRFNVIKAIVAKTNVTVAKFAEAWKKDALEASDISSVRYLWDCKAAIEALPAFDVPNPDLFVYLSGIPRAIDELCEVIDEAIAQRKEEDRFEYPLEGIVFDRMDVIMGFTAGAGKICDREIACRPL